MGIEQFQRSRPLYCILIVFVYHLYWYKWIDRFLLDYSVPKNTNISSLTNYYYISWDYYLSLTVYIVITSFHKRSVNVAPCYLRRDLCHFVLANSGPLSLEKLMLCKSTDKMHSFNRRLSTQVCSCKEIKTLLSLEMWVHDKPQWQHCLGNFTCKITL